MKRFLFVLAVLLAASAARAQEQKLVVMHQGRLLTQDDTPLEGPQQITVSLWTASDAESPTWSETYAVTLVKGFYAIGLGETKGQKKPIAVDDVAGDRFLSITLGGTELLPRQRLGVVPRAANAATADLATDAKALGGRPAADFALKADVVAKVDAEATYLRKTDAASTYLTADTAGLTFLPKTEAAATYLTKTAGDALLGKTEAAGLYLTKTAGDALLGKTEAVDRYQPKGSYLTLAGGTLTGPLAAPSLKVGDAYVRWNTTTRALETSTDNAAWSSVGAGEPQAAWWNAAWGYRRPLVVEGPVPKDATIRFLFDFAALEAAGKVRADGADLRVLSGTTELARENDGYDGAGLITAAFRTPEAIADGATQVFWLYYGNPSATQPADDRNGVYLAYEDFEDGNYTTGPTWALRAGTASVVSHQVDGEGVSSKVLSFTAPATYSTGSAYEPGLVLTTPGSDQWTDVIVELDLMDRSGAASYPGPAVRVKNGAVSGTSLWWLEFNGNALPMTMRPIVGDADAGWHYRGRVQATFVTSTWHHLRIEAVGRTITTWVNGARVLGPVETNTNHLVDRGSIALGAHQSSGSVSYWDNIRVERWTPQPVFAKAGKEQRKP